MDDEHEVLGAAHGELLAAEDEFADLRVLERHDRAGALQAVAGTGGDRSASPEGALTEVVAKRSARAFFRRTSNFPSAIERFAPGPTASRTGRCGLLEEAATHALGDGGTAGAVRATSDRRPRGIGGRGVPRCAAARPEGPRGAAQISLWTAVWIARPQSIPVGTGVCGLCRALTRNQASAVRLV
jgi:hypothetical protein